MITNRIYAADVSVLSDKELFYRLYREMPIYRQQKIDRYRFDKDKYLSLGAGVLLAKAFLDAGIPYSDIYCDNNGKPLHNGNICFNLSHSEELAVCAVSDKPVGIDAEKVRSFSESLAERVFTDKELDICSRYEDKERIYTRMWTAKESVMKKTGGGLSVGAKNISLDIIEERPVSASVSGIEGEFILHNFSDGDYEITVCSEYENSAQMVFFDLRNIL